MVSVQIGLVFTTCCWKVVAAEAVLVSNVDDVVLAYDVILQCCDGTE